MATGLLARESVVPGSCTNENNQSARARVGPTAARRGPAERATSATRFAGHSLRPAWLAAAVVVALACNDAASPEPALVITSSVESVAVPRTTQLATRGARGTVRWESSDERVAAVSAAGLVTARFPGVATVTARDGGRSATRVVPVTASRIDVEPSPVTVAYNGAQSLTATARDADGAELAGVPLRWTAGDPRIATVDAASGVLTGRSTGATMVAATGGGVSGLAEVTVGPQTFAPLFFSRIGLGGRANHACGIEAVTAAAYCWGDNHAGALGAGEVAGSDTPLVVSGARRYSSISVAYYATCAVEAETGFAYCWGYNSVGQLGEGGLGIQWVPTLVAGGRIRFSSVSSGGEVTCGIEAGSGLGYCWGKGGLVGDGTLSHRFTPTLVGSGSLRFSSLSASDTHACGVEARTSLAYCWGAGAQGALGDGTTTDRPIPTPVDGSRRFSSVDAGHRLTCGIEAETGLAYCWGQNSRGQVGDGTTTDRLIPAQVAGGNRRFAGVDAGSELTCAVEAQTSLGYCWGRNDLGQVGDGTKADRGVPTLVGGGAPPFSQVSTGYGGACGVAAQTALAYCWGDGTVAPTVFPPSAPQALAASAARPSRRTISVRSAN